MAWRPNEQFIEGVLDNTVPGKVTGWMRFAGLSKKIAFDLEGDFHRDIQGAKIRIQGDAVSNHEEAEKYMKENKCSLEDATIAVSQKFKADGKVQGVASDE